MPAPVPEEPSGPSIRLRPATPSDNGFFRRLEFQTTWDNLDPEERGRFRPSEIRQAIEATTELLLARPGNQVTIAEDESGRRLGLLWYGLNRNPLTGEEEAWVYSVSVVPEHRGRGVGKRLMAYAEELARNDGHTTLGLMVASHNTRARELYERIGFRANSVLMRKRL